MRKIAVLTDSACDIPVELQEKYGIDILPFTITLDGVSYVERKDFTFDEYYQMLREAKGTPSTAHITAMQFCDQFCKYLDEGYTDVLYVSINSTGSATNAAAHQAAEQLREERPDSALRVRIVDSHCYSLGYGYPVVQAAQALRAGTSLDEVIDRLEDTFARTEILLCAYSLKVIRKSGRISAAAAIAGELLGLHPIFTLNDGVSEVVRKVRGEKAAASAAARRQKKITPGLWKNRAHMRLLDKSVPPIRHQIRRRRTRKKTRPSTTAARINSPRAAAPQAPARSARGVRPA